MSSRGPTAPARVWPCGDPALYFDPATRTCVAQCPGVAYADDATGLCTACPAGTKLGADGSMCQPCLAGTFADMGVCVPCQPGMYAAVGSTRCQLCPLGYAVSADRGGCVPCPAGSFASIGPAGCLPCSAGTFAGAPALTVCMTCPVGTVTQGQVVDTDGTLVMGATSCQPCAPGTFSGVGRQYVRAVPAQYDILCWKLWLHALPGRFIVSFFISTVTLSSH
ncbi:hypothetical protein PG993_013732 [Apiospora rasikravindrae]|uniref:Tyrosine-protein kinase ephrin type A/B receptor-like domain-containing protein n=1 Tax=Apiospora rasikravindrae TaxID=990691 RepID=A0ABR1RS76_9PEZI